VMSLCAKRGVRCDRRDEQERSPWSREYSSVRASSSCIFGSLRSAVSQTLGLQPMQQCGFDMWLVTCALCDAPMVSDGRAQIASGSAVRLHPHEAQQPYAKRWTLNFGAWTCRMRPRPSRLNMQRCGCMVDGVCPVDVAVSRLGMLDTESSLYGVGSTGCWKHTAQPQENIRSCRVGMWNASAACIDLHADRVTDSRPVYSVANLLVQRLIFGFNADTRDGKA
jgi:hypothetical protein